jgi:hypothetical protein
VRPVIALDLDGTLVDYHMHFTTFADQYFGVSEQRIYDRGVYDARMPFNVYLGVGKEKYRQCKMAYRRGELKRSTPLLGDPYPHAPTMVRTMRRWGCDVWLCTTRPYLAYDAIDSATRHNLKRHGIGYQGIIWGERKYHDLVRTVGKSRIVGVLDDLPQMCVQAEKLGLPTAFALRTHNASQYEALGLKLPRVETHNETLALFQRWLNHWRRQ